jgi:hypothetical protein
MWIRDPGGKTLGSGINIPDPQHCFVYFIFLERDVRIQIFCGDLDPHLVNAHQPCPS